MAGRITAGAHRTREGGGCLCGHASWVTQSSTACLRSTGRAEIATAGAQELLKKCSLLWVVRTSLLACFALSGMKGCLIVGACRTCARDGQFCGLHADMLLACSRWLAGQQRPAASTKVPLRPFFECGGCCMSALLLMLCSWGCQHFLQSSLASARPAQQQEVGTGC